MMDRIPAFPSSIQRVSILTYSLVREGSSVPTIEWNGVCCMIEKTEEVGGDGVENTNTVRSKDTKHHRPHHNKMEATDRL